tara:strand:- start:855 stop:1040 length:186 start_codon:yes stop_codon:yes gene_type:complete
MAEFNLDDMKLEDLLFVLGGTILQGHTVDEIEIEILLRLEELLKTKIDERMSGIPADAIIH